MRHKVNHSPALLFARAAAAANDGGKSRQRRLLETRGKKPKKNKKKMVEMGLARVQLLRRAFSRRPLELQSKRMRPE